MRQVKTSTSKGRRSSSARQAGHAWLRYRSTEIDDAGQSGPSCAIKFNNFLNSEPLDDLVMWYRAGANHEGGEPDDCHVVGSTFEPLGDWTTAAAPVRATGK